MATVDTKASLADLVDLESHAAWTQNFSSTARESQLEDDLFAGRSVTGVLFAVVCLGMLLMVVTVALCL